MDESTIRAAKDGDHEARVVMFRWLIGELFREFGSHDDDDDVIQEALEDILAKLADAPVEPKTFLSWAFSFVGTERLTAYRNEQRARARRAKLMVHNGIAESPTSPGSHVARLQWYGFVLNCIDKLTAPHARALLHRLDGGSYSELAAREDITVHAAQQRVGRAKQMLHLVIEHERFTNAVFRLRYVS